jgi:hypothetical protein
MAALGTVLMVIGIIIAVIGGMWILVLAFQESVAWGLGCLLVPFVSLIFVIMYWDSAAKAFGLNVLGVILAVAGGGMAGTGSVLD